MSKWNNIAEDIVRRYHEQIQDMNALSGSLGISFEQRIILANNIAEDALSAILLILKHLDEQEARK